MIPAGATIRGKMFPFWLLAFLAQSGFSFGLTAVNALFLANAGSQSLGYVYLGTPFAMAVAIPVSTSILNRWGAMGQIVSSLAACAATSAALFSMYSGDPGALPLPLQVCAMLMANIWLFLLYSSFWNFADCFFDTREARTSYNIMGVGVSGGFAVGGLGASLLSSILEVHSLFLVWGALSLLCLPLPFLISRRFAMQVQVSDPREESSLRRRFASLWEGFRRSPYAVSLAFLFFLVIVMALLSEYLYLTQFEKVLRATSDDSLGKRLARLIGFLSASASILNIFANLLVLPWLVNRVGVRNIVFALPLAYLALFGLVSVELGFPLAIGLFFTYQFLQTSIDQGNQNFLLRALPESVGKELRTVVEGVSEPLAVALVGLLVLPEMGGFRKYVPLGPFLDTDIGLMGAGFALLALLCALVVRRSYRTALRQNLDGGAGGASAAEEAREDVETRSGQVLTAGDVAALESACARGGFVREPAALIDLRKLDADGARRLMSLSPWFDTSTLGLPDGELARIPLHAVPTIARTMQDPGASHVARMLAARVVGRLAPTLFGDLLVDLESEIVRSMRDCRAKAENVRREGAGGIVFHWYRQRTSDLLDLLFELAALEGRIPEFRSVRRMLHSSSAFDRAHAVDVVEQGFPHDVFRHLLSLMEWLERPAAIDWSSDFFSPGLLEIDLVEDPACAVVRVGLAASRDRRAAVESASWYLRRRRPLPLRILVHGILEGEHSGIVERIVGILSTPAMANMGLRNAVLLGLEGDRTGGWKAAATRNSGLARLLLEAGWKP